MVFSSITFILYFLPLFFTSYYVFPNKYKNYIILFFSIIFYGWGAPTFIFILMSSTILDFYIVKQLYKSKTKKKKNLFLIFSICTNLGLLLYFKYLNFFIETINRFFLEVGFSNIDWIEVALPIGISFYTFQTLTYSIDIYKGARKPLNKVTDYLLYIVMFPQMIAGPIVRFNTIAEQITNRIVVSSDVLIGFYRFVIGLSKKVLIANVMGSKADEIMSMDFSTLDSTTAWIGISAYTFQIYFDFAGYSDMAIGIGRMLGFTFPENFNNPYVSKNITEFWRRWHITLGAWMKDYLYIPLGGNKVNSKTRLFFNLWIVFFISGLWHGAAWNFVLWGVFHGTFLILDRLFLIQILNKSGQILSVIFTFFITILGWVIFRIEDFSMAKAFYKKLFSFDFNPIEYGFNNNYFFTILLIAILFSFITTSKRGRQLEEYIYFKDYNSYIKTCTMFIIVLTLLMLSIASITSSEFNPFIYFRF